MKRIYKNFYLVLLTLVLTSFISSIHAQLSINDTPDSLAVVGKQYLYQVKATPPAGVTYSFDMSLEDMHINGTSGIIDWIPSSVTKGGKVVVRATNGASQTTTKTFFIYVSDPLDCSSNGVVSYWKLNENGGFTYIDYCGSNNAINTGTALIDTTGVVDKAKKFSRNAGNKVSVPYNPTLDFGPNDDFAYEFWYNNRLDDLDSNYVILGRNEGSGGKHWWIGMNKSEKVEFFVRGTPEADDSIDNSSSYNTWYHVFVTRDGVAGDISLYRQKLGDNFYDSRTFHFDDNGSAFTSSAGLDFGWLRPGGLDNEGYHYDGKLDEIVMYNKHLSVADVEARIGTGAPTAAVPYENFAPVFRTTPTTTVNEKSLYTYQYLASDADNTLTTDSYDTVSGMRPSWLTWNKATRTFSGTPSNNDVGIHNVSITVHDATTPLLLISQTFQINVVNVNDKPVISNVETAALAYNEDDGAVALTSAATVTDVDDTNLDSARVWISANYNSSEDVLAFTNTANITGVWNATTGSLKLTGTTTVANYQAAIRSITYENTNTVAPGILTRTVSFTANDGDLNSTVVTRNITVTSVNDCPVISNHATLSTPEDDTILIKLSDLTYTDVDDIATNISVSVASGSNYTFTGNIVTPAADFNGTMNVNVKVTDTKCIVDYVLPVEVTAVNDAPRFNFASLPTNAYEKQTYLLKIRATDADGDPLTFTVNPLPGWLTVINDTILTGIPEFSDIGADPVTIRVSDGIVNVDTSFSITVNTTNDIPHITSAPVTTVNENELYLYNIVVVDTNVLDPLILTAPVIPEWLSLNTDQKILSGTPTQAYLTAPGTFVDFPVQLKVSDGKQDSTQTFVIRVDKLSGVTQITSGSEILKVYPNPAESFVMFEMDATGILNIEIIDITGKTLFKNNFQINGAPVRINTVDIPEGLYFYKVTNNSQSFVGNLIIRK